MRRSGPVPGSAFLLHGEHTEFCTLRPVYRRASRSACSGAGVKYTHVRREQTASHLLKDPARGVQFAIERRRGRPVPLEPCRSRITEHGYRPCPYRDQLQEYNWRIYPIFETLTNCAANSGANKKVWVGGTKNPKSGATCRAGARGASGADTTAGDTADCQEPGRSPGPTWLAR